jgi:hypothetical protein
MRSAILFLAGVALFAQSRPPDIQFERRTLDLGANETCAIVDVNGDKRLDIVAGENWFENPTWKRHKFRDIAFTNNYIDNFSDLPLDVNGDGRIDIVSASWFSRKLSWFANPGTPGAIWKETVIESGHPIEFAFLVDLNNDGKANDILPQFGSEKAPLAWYELKDGAFVKHVASENSYGHGIGAGDVNGDKLTDILTPKGWLEAPNWKLHTGFPAETQLGFMFVMDFNQDGRNDIVTSLAHDYGIFWLEQNADGSWTKRLIDDSWSQAHAITLIDLNGDGRKDLLTGKRYMAHNGKDPGEREPLGIYWYEQMLNPQTKRLEWVRHLIDYGGRAGGGMQIPVADIDGDGDLDFAVAGKSGAFLYINRSR